MKKFQKKSKFVTVPILVACFLIQNLFYSHKSLANNVLGSFHANFLPNLAAGPVILQGIKADIQNPFAFDFIAKCDLEGLSEKDISEDFDRQIRYFLTALTLPESDLWVNFSPFEEDRIIPEKLSQTELGEVMLISDYFLKQITSTFMSPDNESGQKLWDKIYKKAYQAYGTTNIQLNFLNKVWIVPEKAVVYQKDNTALILDSHLKVMLEKDYLATQQNLKQKKISSEKESKGEEKDEEEGAELLSSEVFRNIIIPEIEKAINQDSAFSPLRQIYHALILAKWYKDYFYNSLLYSAYVDKNKVAGIDSIDKEFVSIAYQEYLNLFKNGVQDLIRVEYSPYEQKNVARHYFTGGIFGTVENEYTSYFAGSPILENKNNFVKGRYEFHSSDSTNPTSSNIASTVSPEKIEHFFETEIIKKGGHSNTYIRVSYFSPDQVKIFADNTFIQKKSGAKKFRTLTREMSAKDLELGLTVVETFTQDEKKDVEILFSNSDISNFLKKKQRTLDSIGKNITISKEILIEKTYYTLRGPDAFHLSIDEDTLKELFKKFDDNPDKTKSLKALKDKILKYKNREQAQWFFNRSDLYSNYHSERNPLSLQDLLADTNLSKKKPDQKKPEKTLAQGLEKTLTRELEKNIAPKEAFESQKKFNQFFEYSLKMYFEQTPRNQMSLDGPNGFVHFLFFRLFKKSDKANRGKLSLFLGLGGDAVRKLLKAKKTVEGNVHKKTIANMKKALKNFQNYQNTILRLFYITFSKSEESIPSIIEKFQNKIKKEQPKLLMIEPAHIFRDLLQDLLDSSGLTINQFSEFAGIPDSSVIQILKGKNDTLGSSSSKEISMLFIRLHELILKNMDFKELLKYQENLEMLFLGLSGKRSPEDLWEQVKSEDLSLLDMAKIIERQKNINRIKQYTNLPQPIKEEITQDSFLGNLSRFLAQEIYSQSSTWHAAFASWLEFQNKDFEKEIIKHLSEKSKDSKKNKPSLKTETSIITITEKERKEFDTFFKEFLLEYYFSNDPSDINPKHFFDALLLKENNPLKENKIKLMQYLDIGRLAFIGLQEDSNIKPQTTELHKKPLMNITRSCSLDSPYDILLARILRGNKGLSLNDILKKYDKSEIKTDEEKRDTFCLLFNDLIKYSGFSQSYIAKKLKNLNFNYITRIVKGNYVEIGLERQSLLINLFVPLMPDQTSKGIENKNIKIEDFVKERQQLEKLLLNLQTLEENLIAKKIINNIPVEPIFSEYLPERQEDFNKFFKKQLVQYIKMTSLKEAHIFGKYGFINYLLRIFNGKNHILQAYLGIEHKKTFSRLVDTEPNELGDSKATSSRITHDLAERCLSGDWTTQWILYHISRGDKNTDLTKEILIFKEKISKISEIRMVDREIFFLKLFKKILEFSGVPITVAAKELGYSTRGGLSVVLSGEEIPNISKTDDIVDLLYPDFSDLFSSIEEKKEINKNKNDLKLLFLGLNCKRTAEELWIESKDPTSDLSTWQIPSIIRRQNKQTIPDSYEALPEEIKKKLKRSTFENYLFQFEKKNYKPDNQSWEEALIYLLGFKNKLLKQEFLNWIKGYDYHFSKATSTELKSITFIQKEYQLSKRTTLKTLLTHSNIEKIQEFFNETFLDASSFKIAKIIHSDKTVGFFIYHTIRKNDDKTIEKNIIIDAFDYTYTQSNDLFYFIFQSFVSELLSENPEEKDKIISLSINPEMLSLIKEIEINGNEKALYVEKILKASTKKIKKNRIIKSGRQKGIKDELGFDPNLEDPIVINASKQPKKKKTSKRQENFNEMFRASLKEYLLSTPKDELSLDGQKGIINFLLKEEDSIPYRESLCEFLSITKFGLQGLLARRQPEIGENTHKMILEKITKKFQASQEDILTLYYIARGNKKNSIKEITEKYFKEIEENPNATYEDTKNLFRNLIEELIEYTGIDYIQLSGFLEEDRNEILKFWNKNSDFFGLSIIDKMVDFFMTLDRISKKDSAESDLDQIEKNFKIILKNISETKNKFSSKTSSSVNSKITDRKAIKLKKDTGGIDFTNNYTVVQKELSDSTKDLNLHNVKNFYKNINGLTPIRIDLSTNFNLFSFYGILN